VALSFAGGPGLSFKKLRENDLDVAIGRFPEVPDHCRTSGLFEEAHLVVARLDHPWIRQKLDLGTCLALGHLIVSFAGDLLGSRRATRPGRIIPTPWKITSSEKIEPRYFNFMNIAHASISVACGKLPV
jgi:DNA-binding transcriptional LysR family regulator